MTTSKKISFAPQHFEYYVLVEHDEKYLKSIFSGNQFMEALDMAI